MRYEDKLRQENLRGAVREVATSAASLIRKVETERDELRAEVERLRSLLIDVGICPECGCSADTRTAVPCGCTSEDCGCADFDALDQTNG